MPTEYTTEPNEDDTAELCIQRLTRKLSEVEIVMETSEGKANQMRKERDAERKTNERLRKEVTSLKNELSKVQINAAVKQMEIIEEYDHIDGTTGDGNIAFDLLTSQKRRSSLPVTARWRQTGLRRDSLENSRDLRKLLDKQSNELLQQRQQYRIFENKFQSQAERCSKLEQDAERLKMLLGDLLGIHDRYHRSLKFPCSKFNVAVFVVLIALIIIAVFALQ